MKNIFTEVLLLIIRGYQLLISPLFPGRCRFYPTCSEYFRLSLIKWGLFRGTWKGLIRIAKCHPFHPGGYDPV
ncbi:MAG: membrane protein insertion efficiency factor YidD [Candidatus Auribacterota bacterium]|nr:membrane protein insertion efficiency factor YidD [Candidatus Auribacterota bacterium]